MTPLLATNRATVFQLAEYQILCGNPGFTSKAPSWTNTRGLKITEESLLPSFCPDSDIYESVDCLSCLYFGSHAGNGT